jgi:hypothetical protein
VLASSVERVEMILQMILLCNAVRIMRITTPSCVLGLVMVWEVFLLRNIAKDWLGFLPLLRRVSYDTSCVLVHGYSSYDIGLL